MRTTSRLYLATSLGSRHVGGGDRKSVYGYVHGRLSISFSDTIAFEKIAVLLNDSQSRRGWGGGGG
jgi:hypothetical protein